MSEAGPSIQARDVVFSYQAGKLILQGVGLELRKGEILGILGPNGSGKTTLVKCLNRLLTPAQGEILLNGSELGRLKKSDIARIVGFVPQAGAAPSASPLVFDVVMMGRRPHMTWQSTKADEDRVWEVMSELDIARLASRPFVALSSGQIQRVLIARALAQDAEVLLMDEPTSNLDVKYQIEVMNIIRGLVEDQVMSACVIVHDLDMAMKYCDKIVLLDDGRVVAAGTAAEALTAANIERVYGVKAFVENIHGRNRVMIV